MAPEEKKDEPKVADIKDWEGVKVMPQPKPQMDLEGITWVLVDEIEILNKESEDKHIFTIKEAKDSYRSRQKLKYPDGTTVEDTGRAHVDGYSEFKLLTSRRAARSSSCAAWTTSTATTSSRCRSTARRSASCRASAPTASTAGATGRR